MTRNKRINKVITGLFLLLLFIGITDSCAEDEKTSEPLELVTIWNAPYINGQGSGLDFSSAPDTVQIQRRGFEKGMTAYKGDIVVEECIISEAEAFEDVVEYLASVYNNRNIVMSVGASSDIMTMYTAMESTFFNISYLIPFSDGDLLAEGPQGYTVRLTVTGQKYADYIGSEILPVNTKDLINNVLFENKTIPNYSVTAAVFFMDNFNDHETAVGITQRLIDNGIDIQYHMAYPSGGLLTTLAKCMEDSLNALPDIDVVILIGEDHDPIPDLPDILKLWANKRIPPSIIVIGYDPKSYPSEVRAADNLYLLDQSIDWTNCPSDIVNFEEASGYAAGYLTMKVLDEVKKNQPEKPHGLSYWLKTDTQKAEDLQMYWDNFRADVWTKLAGVNDTIPCYGDLRLNATSGNNSKLELYSVNESGILDKADPGEIFERILSRKRAQFGLQ